MTGVKIGQPVPRNEDERFLTGLGRYVDDITICLSKCFTSQPLSMKSLANQSNNFGWLGNSP